MVLRRALGPDRGRLLSSDRLADWLGKTFDHTPRDIEPYARALTHGSQAAANYERLEFLGDRVLGLVIASWLYERFPDEAEGSLSKRLNALVAGAVIIALILTIGYPLLGLIAGADLGDGASATSLFSAASTMGRQGISSTVPSCLVPMGSSPR